MSAAIAKKNKLVSSYSRNSDRVVLLRVSSLGSLESTFAAPPEIRAWRFDFDFDRVLVLVQEPGALYDLLRA